MARKRVENTAYIDIQDVISLDRGELYNFDFLNGIKTTGIVYENYCVVGNQRVQFSTTKNGFGYRKWFVCSGCKKNFKRLYMPLSVNVLGCRNCHKLTYIKSQLSGNDFAYVTRMIRELQFELEVSEENYWPIDGAITNNSIEWLPMYKPKNMRWETFTRKRELLELMIVTRIRIWLEKAKMY